MAQPDQPRPPLLTVWCDGSADPRAGRVAWACISSGLEAHGRACIGNAGDAYGIEITEASSAVAEALALAAGLRLGKRILGAILKGRPPGPALRLVTDAQTIVNGLAQGRMPRPIPPVLRALLEDARDAGTTFVFAPRVSTPELDFADNLAHTALRRADLIPIVAETSRLLSDPRNSIEVGNCAIDAIGEALARLDAADRRRGGGILIPESFRIMAERSARGPLRITRLSGQTPLANGRSAIGRVAEHLRRHDEATPVPTGV